MVKSVGVFPTTIGPKPYLHGSACIASRASEYSTKLYLSRSFLYKETTSNASCSFSDRELNGNSSSDNTFITRGKASLAIRAICMAVLEPTCRPNSGLSSTYSRSAIPANKPLCVLSISTRPSPNNSHRSATQDISDIESMPSILRSAMVRLRRKASSCLAVISTGRSSWGKLSAASSRAFSYASLLLATLFTQHSSITLSCEEYIRYVHLPWFLYLRIRAQPWP